MDKETFDAVVNLLTPYMGAGNDRRSFIDSALYGNDNLIQQIDFSGPAHAFTVSLVRKASDFGTLTSGKPAVVALLEHLRSQVGGNKQEEIDTLIKTILGGAAPAASPQPSPSPGAPKPMSSLKRRGLEDELAQIHQQYEAVHSQYLTTLDASNKIILKRQLDSLEEQAEAIEAQLRGE